MGSLAARPCQDGQQLSGVLVKRGFNYHLIDPVDLNSKYMYIYILITVQ